MPTTFPRIRKDLTRMGLGVVQITTKTTKKREHDRRVVIFDDLVADSQIETIRALVNGDVSWEELVNAKRRGELAGATVLDKVKAERPLADAVTATLPLMGKAEGTRDRYALSLRQLQAQTVVPWPHTPMRVKDLAALDWPTLQAGWPNSAGDWNNLVRAVGRFLTLYLGHKHHAFRLEVMKRPTMKKAKGRVPDLSLAVFEAIMATVPEHVRPAYYTLLLTGMRVRTEYLRCTAADLLPATLRVNVPGTKTDDSDGTVSVAASMWPWVAAGIPSPLGYTWLRIHWNRACLEIGAAEMVPDPKRPGHMRYKGLVMHDLRHALAQWTSDAGIPINQVQDMLRHASPAMTAKYARQTASKVVASTIANLITRKGA